MRLVAAIVVLACLMLTVATTSEVSGSTPETGRISGVVTNTLGIPLADVFVLADRTTCCDRDIENAFTALDGSYEIVGLLPGNYEVTANEDGFQATSLDVFVSTDAVTRGVDFMLAELPPDPPDGAISGRITHLGVGVSGASVLATPVGEEEYTNSAITDGSGAYVIEGVSSGNYNVLAYVSGNQYAPEYYDGSYTRSTATTIAVSSGVVTPSIDIELAVGGSISGHVKLPDGSAAAFVSVTALNSGLRVFDSEFMVSASANVDGFYQLHGLSPGAYKVRSDSSALGVARTYFESAFSPETANEVSVTLGQETANIEITLGLTGSIAGMVTGVEDETELDAVGGPCCTNEIDVFADGPYLLAEVQPGCHFIEADFGDREYYNNRFYRETADSVCVNPGQAVNDIDFHLAPRDNDFIEQLSSVFTLPFFDTRSTVGTSLEPGEPIPCGMIGATIWYRFAMPNELPLGAIVRIDTSGTFDRVIAVYLGDPLSSPPGGFASTQVDCEGDPSFGYLDFAGTPGATYYVQLGGRNGTSGDVAINIRCLADDDCDGALDNNGDDNCAGIYNPGQDDQDGDGIGDFCDNDVDGDGLANFDEHNADTEEFIADTDGDGCLDGAEALGADPAFGGLRDPLNYWDFYDVDGNANVDLFDTLAILGKFGALPGDDQYDDRFDRMIPIGNPGYESAQASGDAIGIDLGDALANLQSFGHLCAI